MESWLSRITDYLLAQSWQIAVLIVVVAIVSFLLRNRSAHVRYLIWLLVLAKCLVPPLHSVPFAVLPQEQPIAFVESSPMAGRTFDASRIERDIVTEPAKSTSVQAPMAPPPKTAKRPLTYNIRAWLAMGWLVGAVALLFYNLLNALRTQIWLQRQRTALPVKFRHNVENFFSTHGVKHIPNVWLINGMNQPFVWGLLRGSIYLPADLLNFQDSKSWASLLGHELSHVVRFDAIVHTLQIFAQVVFWFHPFVWWANRKIRAEREKCCDEMAIVSLHALPEDYSEAIVEVLAAKYESIRPVPSLAVAGPVKNIEERIKTMLRPGKKFYKRPSLIAATFVFLLALLTVPTALVLTARAETKAGVSPLNQAVADGNINKVRSLISKGADVNAMGKNDWTSLHFAAYYCLKDVAEVLLAKGANINATDVSGLTPLHLAAEFGARYVPELLLAKGANINARDKAGNTPLHYAAGRLSVQKGLLELLIAKGADINARNDQGRTPLHRASPWIRPYEKYHLIAANVLLTHGANVNAKDNDGCTPLYIAARRNGKNIVQLLLSKGAIISEKTNEGMTALHIASMAGHKDVVELLLNEGANVNATQWSGWIALHFAARAGHNGIVELLTAKGADENAKNIRGETPVHLAIVQNHKDTVKLLISKGAEISTIQLASYIGDLAKVKSFVAKGVSVNAQDGYWLTPLHAATASGQREVAEFLIGKGAVVNADAAAEGPGMPLHYAADGGSQEVTELLISKGAIVNARNKNGENPLHLAAKRGYKDVAQLLIASKAKVNAKDRDDRTPLHYAAIEGQKVVAEVLIDNGADTQVVDKWKRTPLLSAARSEHKDVVKLLIDKGADVSLSVNLLYNAAWKGHRDLVELLIKKGADVNTESEAWGEEGRGLAPSLYAVWGKWGNQTDILELLLNHGADPDAKDRWYWSLLHYAVYDGSMDMTRMLLDKGANANVKENEYGKTPLHWTAERGHKAVAELLISHGADVNAKDYDGRTPLSDAKDGGHTEVVELLRKHGAK